MKDRTDIVFILNESGSMYNLAEDTIGGFNSVLEQQKNESRDALVTTVFFNPDVKNSTKDVTSKRSKNHLCDHD